MGKITKQTISSLAMIRFFRINFAVASCDERSFEPSHGAGGWPALMPCLDANFIPFSFGLLPSFTGAVAPVVDWFAFGMRGMPGKAPPGIRLRLKFAKEEFSGIPCNRTEKIID